MPKDEPMISQVVIDVMDITVYNWRIQLFPISNPQGHITPETFYTGTFDSVNRVAVQIAENAKEPIGRILLIRAGEA